MKTNDLTILEWVEELFKTDDLIRFSTNCRYPSGQVSFPPYDVYVHEETKDLLYEFALAGISKDSVNVNLDGDFLTLEIEKDTTERDDGFVLQRTGIKKGKGKLRFGVPASKFDHEKAEAKFEEGILSIRIPAKEHLKGRKLLIN